MRVTVNQVEGEMTMQGMVVSFTPNDGPSTGPAVSVQFKSTDVSQLLRSRKDMCCAKLVVAKDTYLLQFESPAAREELVDMIVKSQSAIEDVAHAPEQWVTTSICGAAVDLGLLDAEELDYILKDQYQRGVAQAFDALESLVDGDSLQLRVLTEQVENDVLRQIPILAAVFEKVVVDVETKRAFWEAVVRKYFCFSRTFLETEMHQIAQAHAEPASSAAAPEGLSAINATSLHALPKAPATAMLPTAAASDDDEFAALKDLDEDGAWSAEEVPLVSRLFRGSPRTPPPPHAPAPLRSLVPVPAVLHSAEAVRDYGRAVRHQLPAEGTPRDVLESLRTFWRRSAAQRDRAALPAPQKGRKRSFVERLCVDRAEEVLKLNPQ